MAEQNNGETWKEYLKYIISAFVSVTHIIAFFQIVICSRHLAVAFNIPSKNIGIYFAKLYSLRSLLMSMGCGVEYGIYRIVQTISPSDSEKNNGGIKPIEIRKYFSMGWFVLLTICEFSFLIVLYSSKNVAYHNYIVLNLEGMLFGFFQMSIISLIPEFASYYVLSLYVSGTCIFIVQTIIDRCTKNSMLSVKIQSWICVLCSLICVGIWPVRLFVLKDTETKPEEKEEKKASQGCGSGNSTTTGGSTTNGEQQSQSTAEPSVGGSGGVGDSGSSENSTPSQGSELSGPSPPSTPSSPKTQMAYLMSLGSITILKIMTNKFCELCEALEPKALKNVQILLGRLQQIKEESQITYDMLVGIDLVILALKKCSCPSGELILLAQLAVFLRIKLMVKTEDSEVVSVSHPHRGINRYGGLPVRTLLYEHPIYQYPYIGNRESVLRAKRSPPGEQPTLRRRRQRRNTQEPTQQCKSFAEHLLASLSPLLMFPVGSLVKDFLFPGVIPYGLLERDKCHLINLIVIIFLSIGPVVIFIINQSSGILKEKVDPYHYFWLCMIPKIVILIISLCAIHTKQGCTHKIRSSQSIVLFMTVVLLTCYGFLETMSFVGMAFYVKLIAKDTSLVDLQAIHNVFGKFFRYLVYKLSVGYNKTRIGAGFTLPNFKPPEPIPNTFCYWFLGAFSNGWKDIVGDFKMGIKQYLEVS